MALWILRLFSQFRELEALAEMQARAAESRQAAYDSLRERMEAQRNALLERGNECDSLREDLENAERAKGDILNEKILLEDRLAAMTEEKDRAWATADRAIDGERYALHTMVNHATQKGGGGVPYPDAHTLPAAEVRKVQTPGPVGRRGRVLMSEMAQRETSRFVEEFVGTLRQPPGDSPEKAA